MGAGSLDKVFFALSDPTRRRIIQALSRKECTVLELSDMFDMTFQAVAKHVVVLENAEIVQKEKKGRNQVCSLEHDSMKDALKWISDHHELWRDSFKSLEAFLKKNKRTS